MLKLNCNNYLPTLISKRYLASSAPENPPSAVDCFAIVIKLSYTQPVYVKPATQGPVVFPKTSGAQGQTTLPARKPVTIVADPALQGLIISTTDSSPDQHIAANNVRSANHNPQLRLCNTKFRSNASTTFRKQLQKKRDCFEKKSTTFGQH